MRVTGPPETPEELAAVKRQVRRSHLRALVVPVIVVVIVLGVTMAVVTGVEHWGRCALALLTCKTN
jgi:hypothetical protein